MNASGAELTGESLHPGTARGPLLVLTEPVSFWGGVNADGVVVDRHHPQRGTSVAGRVVVMRDGRGSSSASAVLAEQIRSGHAPAALLVGERDAVLLLGALVAAELYGVRMPVVWLDGSALDRLCSDDEVEVRAGDPPGPATVRPCVAAR
jgi:predicted aconitase with swiveling domain